MYLVYNSVLSPLSDFGVDVEDRAFQYGDGLFETLRYQGGRVAFWPDHYDRLRRGMAACRLDPPADFTSGALHGQLLALLDRNELTGRTARIKIQVWRQPGGLYTPTNNRANILITARLGQPFTVSERERLGIFEGVRLSPSVVSAYKTTSALPYVLAGLAKQDGGFDDMLLLDTHGHVAECIASAVFWVRGETLWMPSLQTGCIDGILRRQLLRLAPELGFQVREGLFSPEEVAADAVFCGNVMGIQRFGAVNGLAVNQKKPLNAGVEQNLTALFRRLV
ncbi:MAG: aminotransferase class IV family protein [Bacteroidetes bacterium]|nr:aminotransferase class IV family protein [Fibrella sp.]